MPDRREEIIRVVSPIGPNRRGDEYCVHIEGAKVAMDEYMKESCLDLLNYLGNNQVVCGTFSDGNKFYFKGEWITKEQLFENFL